MSVIVIAVDVSIPLTTSAAAAPPALTVVTPVELINPKVAEEEPV